MHTADQTIEEKLVKVDEEIKLRRTKIVLAFMVGALMALIASRIHEERRVTQMRLTMFERCDKDIDYILIKQYWDNIRSALKDFLDITIENINPSDLTLFGPNDLGVGNNLNTYCRSKNIDMRTCYFGARVTLVELTYLKELIENVLNRTNLLASERDNLSILLNRVQTYLTRLEPVVNEFHRNFPSYIGPPPSRNRRL